MNENRGKMRYALFLFPFLPIVLALLIAGPKVADALPKIDAFPVGIHDYRISTLRPDGTIISTVVVTLPFQPQIHINSEGRQSVGAFGLIELEPLLPSKWCYLIEKVNTYDLEHGY